MKKEYYFFTSFRKMNNLPIRKMNKKLNVTTLYNKKTRNK